MDSTEQSSIPDNIFDSLPNEQSTIPDNVFDHLPETRFTPVPAPKITGAIPIYGQAQEQPAYSFTPLLGNEGQAAIAPTRELPLPPPADWETNQNIATGMAAGAGQVLVGAGSELGKTAVYALHSLPIPTERADTPEFKQWAYEENRRRSALSPGQKMKEVRKDSVFQAATQAEEWAKENLPVSRKNQQFTVLSHTPFEFHPVGAAESAAGLIPMVASGPLAPVTIGLQSFGSHLGNDFDNLKSQGMSDDDAAKVTVDRALLSGAAGATIFALLPKPLHAAGDKYLIEKFGETALKRFIAARAAGAIEGAVLMPSAHVAENIISGRPATEGLVDSAVGGAVLVGLSPRGKSEAEQAFLGKPGYKFDEDAKARALATPVPIRLSDEAAAIARGRRAQPTYAEPITQDGSTPTVLRGATQEQSGGAETRNEAAPINPEVPIEPGPLGEFPAIQPVVTRGGKRYEKRGAVWHALDEPGEPVVVRADDTTKKLVSDLEAKLAGEKPKTGGGLLQVTIGEPITTQQANQIAQRIRYAVGGVRILDAEGQPVDISALTQGARTKFEAGEPHSKPGIIAALKALGVVVNDEGAAKKESPVAVVSEPEKPAGAPVPPPVTEVVPPAPVKPEIVAKEIGFTVKPTYSTEGLTPEQVATAAKTNPQRLNFTDERPPGESPTSGLTFTVPVGATREEVLAQLEKSKQGYTPPKPKAVEPVVPKVEPPPAKPEVTAKSAEDAMIADGLKDIFDTFAPPPPKPGEPPIVPLGSGGPDTTKAVEGMKKIGRGLVMKGTRNFDEWKTKMVEALGKWADQLSQHLEAVWKSLVSEMPELETKPEKGFLAQKLAAGKTEASQSQVEEQRRISDEVAKRSTEESAPTLLAAKVAQVPSALGKRPEPVVIAGSAEMKDSAGKPFIRTKARVSDLALLPNFKLDADRETGVVPGMELKGPYERSGEAHVLVMRRNDGSLAVITGRHRVDLARREGIADIPVDIYDEKHVDLNSAKVIDAENNIFNNQGTIYDIANFFREFTAYTADELRRRGLSRNKLANDALTVARNSATETNDGKPLGNGDGFFDIWLANRGNDKYPLKDALAIVTAAPKNHEAQLYGLRKLAEGKTGTELYNLVRRVADETPKMTEGELFGETAEFKNMEAEEAAAESMRKELNAELNRKELAAITKGARADLTPDQAAVKIAMLKKQLADLRGEWWLKPIEKEVKRRAGTLPQEPKPPEKKSLKPGGDLLADVPFNLTGEKPKFVEPSRDVTGFGGESLTQNDLFSIAEVTKEVDPFKSANAAEKMYGSAREAVTRLKNQLRVMDSDREVAKSFTKEQRQRLADVIRVLNERSGINKSTEGGQPNVPVSERSNNLRGEAGTAKTAPQEGGAGGAPGGEPKSRDVRGLRADPNNEKFSLNRNTPNEERLKKYGNTRDEQAAGMVQSILRQAFQRRSGNPAYTARDSVVATRPGLVGAAKFDPRGIEGFERLFGKRLVFYKDMVGGAEFGGLAYSGEPDVIFVNSEDPHPWLRVAAHELFHQLRLQKPGLYRDVFNALKDDLAINRRELSREYKSKGYSPGEVPEEVLADLLGDVITEPKFWERFAKNNPTAFERVTRSIIDWLNQAVEFLSGGKYGATKFFKDVERARNVMADALAKYAAERGVQGEFSDSSSEMFSLNPRHQVSGVKDLGEEYTPESINDSLARIRSNPRFDFSSPTPAVPETPAGPFSRRVTPGRAANEGVEVNPANTERAIRLISDLSDPTRSQGVLSELKFTAPGEMSGSLLVGDVLDYATRLIRDTGDQSLFELMRRNAADIAKDYGGTTSTKAGRVLRGDMWASRRTLWKNAVEIFKEYEDKALTKLFGAEKGREIAGFIRDALRNGPVTDPTEINKIVDERLERYGVTPEIKTALRILDAYERSQTEWLKPDVKNDIKEIIKASIGETLRYKQANEADGGKDFRTRLSDRLFERTKRSIDEANLKIEKENANLEPDKQKPLISDSPEALDTLRRQMDDLSYEVWKDKGQRETSTTAKAWEKERGFEDATAQRLIGQWTRDQTEWLKDARKSKVSESIKEFLKSGGMTEEQLRTKLIADGAKELTARELAFQAVKRKATLDANRKQASIDSEASRISGLAQKTAEQILEGMETRLPSGAEWLKPDEKNAVPEIVKQALQTKPSAKDVESMGELEASRKVAPITDAFSTELVDKLKAAGVSEDIAMRLAQEVANTRQAQWASARVRAMERASKSGRVSTLMDEILAAPYLLQQKPEWREQVARRWFELNGLDKPGAIEATKLFQSAFQDALNKATEELVKRLAARADPQAQNVEEFINALRAGLLDASKPWSAGFAEKAGWSLPNADQMRKLADLDLKLENKDLTLIERNELVEEMMGIYLKLRPPPSLAKILAGNLIATNLTGIRTVTINIGGPSLYLLFDRAMHTLAAPHEIGRIWSPVFEAFRGFLKEARYSMSTDAYTVVNNAFGPASDQLRRLWETGLEDVRSDSYARRAKGAVKMIFGGQQFFMRLLNSLDQASSVVIREASLTYYGGEVFKRAGMGTKDIADMVQLTHNLKSALYHEALENGMDPVRARVHSDARANEILPSMISERLSLPTAEGGAGMDEIAAIREARKAAEAAEADAYSSVGRLMPGVSETDEGGFLSRNAFIHSLLRVSSNLRRSDAQDRILAVSLLGYLNIPIRTARFYAWNSPYGLIRLAYHHARKARMGADWDNQWKQSLANEHQEWYRLQNALASTFVMTALTATGLAFWGASAYSDDKSRKNGIFITGSGPANANALDEWKKVGFRQNSIIIFMGGHPVAIPLGRLGEPMAHLFSILAARDDYNWRKKEAEVSKRPFKETWTQSVGYGLGTYAGILGQRGIISNVARWGRAFGSEGGAQAALASTIGGVAAGVTMPYLGLQRSIRDMVMGKVDTTSVSAAIMANFPVLGAFQNGAVNRFGDPLGDQSWYGKIADTGVPIAFQVADNPKNRALYTALVEKGITPPVLRRAVVEEKYGPLTDTEWNKLATRSGALLKAQTLDNLGSIEKMPSADGKKLLSSLASASDRTAALGLGLQVVTTSAGSASGGSAGVSGAGAGGLLAGGGLLASNRGLTDPSGLLGGGGGGSGGSGSSGGRVSTRGSRVSRSRGRLGLRGGARRLSLRRGTRRSLISGRNRIAGRMRRPGMRMRRLSLA